MLERDGQHPSGHVLAIAVAARRDAELLVAELRRWPARVWLDAGTLARQSRLPRQRVVAALERLASGGELERGRTAEPRTYRLRRRVA